MSRDNTVITNNENESNNFENKSNKQIEEMAKDLDACPFLQAPIGCDQHEGSIAIAEYLYNAGYRKASDLAEEIFAEIEKALYLYTYPHVTTGTTATAEPTLVIHLRNYAELKKKYTEGGE